MLPAYSGAFLLTVAFESFLFTVVNAVGRRNTQMSAKDRKGSQMSAKERKRKSAKERTRVQKNIRERKRALLRKNCPQPGLKQPGLGTPKNSCSCFSLRKFLTIPNLRLWNRAIRDSRFCAAKYRSRKTCCAETTFLHELW